MKILVWGEQFWPYVGGAELFAYRLMTRLKERGFQFAALTRRDDDELPEQDHLEGIPITRMPFWSAAQRDPKQVMEVVSKVTELKRAFRPDVVHLNGLTPTSGFFHSLTQHASAPPTLLTLHRSPTGPERVGDSDSLISRTIAGSDWISCCSDAVKAELLAIEPAAANRITVIRHGMEVPPGPIAPTLEEPTILYLGRLQHVKGVDVAIRAFALLRETGHCARLRIAGDGNERSSLESLVSDLELTDLVTFTGWIEPDSVASVMENANIIVVPSRSEGFGLVALEASALGRPVVASRTGGLPEVVVDGSTGILTEPGDPERFAKAIGRLLDDPGMAENMGKAGRERVEKEFSWTTTIDAYEMLYKRLGQ